MMTVATTLIICSVIAWVTVESVAWSVTMYQHGRWLQKNPAYERRVVIESKDIILAAIMTGLLSIVSWSWFMHISALLLFKSTVITYKFYICALISFGISMSHLNLWLLMSKYVCLPWIFWPCFSKFRNELFRKKGDTVPNNHCSSLRKWRELAEDAKHHQSLLANFVDVMPQLIWTKNMRGEFTFVNNACCKQLLLLPEEEVLGETSVALAEKWKKKGIIYTFGDMCYDSDVKTVQKKGPMSFFEYGLVNDEYLALRVLKAPMFDGQNMVGVVGLAQNVTWLVRKWENIIDLLENNRNEEAKSLLKSVLIDFESFVDVHELLDK